MNILTDKDQFQRWAEHPGTIAFRAYLQKRAQEMAGQWLAGTSLPPETQAQAVVLMALLNLSHNDILYEYGNRGRR